MGELAGWKGAGGEAAVMGAEMVEADWKGVRGVAMEVEQVAVMAVGRAVEEDWEEGMGVVMEADLVGSEVVGKGGG